jgi:hypothetical protein
MSGTLRAAVASVARRGAAQLNNNGLPNRSAKRYSSHPLPASDRVDCLWEHSQTDPVLTGSALCRTVHFQPCDDCSPDSSTTLNDASVRIDAEVVMPWVLARMVEMNDSMCDRINMVDVSPLADIAGTAGKCPVVRRISATMHEWDDMLDLKQEVEHRFGRMTVLAAVSRP